MVNLKSTGVVVTGPGPQRASLESSVTDGLQIINEDVRVTARDGGFAAGEVVMFDLFESESNGAAAALAEVVQPTAPGIIGGGIFAVCLAAIADNAVGTVRVRGLVSGLCIAVSGDIDPGDRLTVSVAGNLDIVAIVGEKYVAISRDSLTTPTTATLGDVLFDGINGFGRFAAS